MLIGNPFDVTDDGTFNLIKNFWEGESPPEVSGISGIVIPALTPTQRRKRKRHDVEAVVAWLKVRRLRRMSPLRG